MPFDLESCLCRALACERLLAEEIAVLCCRVEDVLFEEPNVRDVPAPVTVVGDVHGQFPDVREMLDVCGSPPDVNYLFLGDYVDRGSTSIETISLLSCLKLRYPERVTLLRGNHESRQITQAYGFYNECLQKYNGDPSVWCAFTRMFDFLPIAAVVAKQVLAVHGGLSPSVHALDQLRLLDRFQEVPHEGPISDIMWSDPEGLPCSSMPPHSGVGLVEAPRCPRPRLLPVGSGFAISPRGAGYVFGQDVAVRFLHINALEHLVRAHQLCMQGFQVLFEDACVSTVWSAPNYCFRFGNLASVLEVSDNLRRIFNCFDAAPWELRSDGPSRKAGQRRKTAAQPTKKEVFPGDQKTFKYFK